MAEEESNTRRRRQTQPQMTALVGTDLPSLELVIEAHLPPVLKAMGDFVAVGKALAEIRDRRLYPQQSFEQYVRERWNFSRQRAYQLIAGAAVVSTVVDSDLPPPATERVTRELHSLLHDPPELVAVWQEVLKNSDARNATPRTVRRVRQRRRETARQRDRDQRQSPSRERRETKRCREQHESIVNNFYQICRAAEWLNVTDTTTFAEQFVNENSFALGPKAVRLGVAVIAAIADRAKAMNYFDCVDGEE